jgi:hypothetical protein
MLVLDTMRLEFSLADLPTGGEWRGYRFHVVEAGEGRLGLLTIEGGGHGTLELHYTVRQKHRREVQRVAVGEDNPIRCRVYVSYRRSRCNREVLAPMEVKF